jgi:hypothetical protein
MRDAKKAPGATRSRVFAKASAPAADSPARPEAFDAESLVDDALRRYPQTMARLAE